MGFPIRSNIFQPGTSLQREFSRYPVQAAVLFSVRSHPQFAATFADLFVRLDRLTGNAVAFFAILDPPAQWLELASGKAWWRANRYGCDGETGLSYGDDVLVHEIARTFGVSWTELPALVVSPNLWLGEYLLVPTDERRVEAQFRSIVQFIRKEARPDIGQISDTLNEVSNEETTYNPPNEGVRERLRRTYRFVDHAFFGDRKRFVADLAQETERIQTVLAGARGVSSESSNADGRNLLNTTEPFANPAFDSVAADAAGRLIVPATLAARLFDRFRQPEAWPLLEGLDEQSVVMIESALRAGHLLEQMGQGELPASKNSLSGSLMELRERNERPHNFRRQFQDFSPGAQGLWKALEREVNLSVVQVARHARGVPMPERFAELDPDLPKPQAIVVTGSGRSVSVNSPETRHTGLRSRTRPHRFISLGDAWHVHQVMCGNQAERFDEIMNKTHGGPLPQKMLGHWRDLVGVRNHASHADILSSDGYRRVLNLVLEKGILDHLVPIKRALS